MSESKDRKMSGDGIFEQAGGSHCPQPASSVLKSEAPLHILAQIANSQVSSEQSGGGEGIPAHDRGWMG